MRIFPGDGLQRRLMAGVTALLIVGLGLAAALWARGRQAGEAPRTPQTSPAPLQEALPLDGLTILVDPGHGGYDGGARCRDSGVWEKEINLAVARTAEKSLIRRGAVVVMTRREDEDLCTEDRPSGQTMKRQDMERRVQMAVEHGADMVLSIHMNEYRDRRESGPQVFYRAGSETGRLLAGCMQEALVQRLVPEKTRTAMSGDYFILQLDVPSVLVECGFISNAREEARLLSADYQARLGEAIADGVAEYLIVSRRLPQARSDMPPEAAP